VNDRTRVYIDGFNLFYGCLKGTRHRWINLEALCRQELPNNYIAAVRYFTAPVIPRPHKPHEAQNQQMYLRALATLPRVTIHLGHFLEKRTRGYLIDPQTDKPTQQMVRIQVPEEKGTDVNIATYLLLDGTQEMYDVAVIISNDTDLEEPIRAVRERRVRRPPIAAGAVLGIAIGAELAAERQAFYDDLKSQSMGPLWAVLGEALTHEPRVRSVPCLWRYADVRPRVLRAGELVSAEEAERRVVMLLNPCLDGKLAATATLYAGIQLILPGEVARTLDAA